MSVVEEIQNQELAGPTARSFDPQNWLQRGMRADCTVDDMLVICHGIQFHVALDDLRGRLGFVTSKEISPELKALALVSIANRDCLLAEIISQEQALQLSGRSQVSTDQIATQSINLPTGNFSADAICETAVDVSAALLRMCPKVGDGAPIRIQDQHLNDAALDFKVANAYVCAESLWLEIVWNGVRYKNFDSIQAYVSTDQSAERAAIIAFHRHQITAMQSFNLAYLRAISDIENGRAVPLDVSQLNAGFGEGGEVEISHSPGSPDVKSQYLATRSMVPGYYGNMVSQAAESRGGLSLQFVLDGFLLLGTLAQSLARPAIAELKRERKDSLYQADISTFAPVIGSSALIAAVSEGLEVTKELAQYLIDFLSFGDAQDRSAQGNSSAIWSAPLIRVSRDHHVVCVHPLMYPNFRWLIDVWLRKLGFPLDMRGTEFELFARESLDKRIRGSMLSGASMICMPAFTFTPPGGRSEEVDLLIVIGTKVLIGEAKCFLQPVSPVDRRNHREKVRDAAVQVARKAKAAQADPDYFRRRAKELGISISVDFEVLPLVVLNHAIGAGTTVGEVPIVDLRILEMFFEGSMPWMADITPQGNIASSRIERFYESQEDAETAIAAYLQSPPQVRHLKKALRPHLTSVVMPGASGDAVLQLRLQIDADKLLVVSSDDC